MLLLLLLFPAQAFASSADSGRCPWKLPFTISVHTIGTTSRNVIESDPHGGSTGTYSPTLDSENIDFTIDTAIFSSFGKGKEYVTTEFAVLRDTLWYSYSYTDTSWAPYLSNQSASVIIAFVPHKDSILSLTCTFDDGSSYQSTTNSNQYSLVLSSLAFDDTSIYCSGSIEDRTAQFTVSSSSNQYLGPYSTELGTFNNSDFTASDIGLSGIFRPKNLIIDSTIQPGPLQLPSQIIAHAVGTEDSGGLSFPSSQDFWWSVSNAPVINNVLQVSDSYYGHEDIPPQTLNSSSSFEISFVHGTDSIASISFDTSYQLIGPGYTRSLTFQISSVVYDSTMIFTTDSSFCTHNISLAWSESGGNSTTDFTATSATLSGIFRPTHYTCAESVSEPKASDARLTVAASNHSLLCSFDASDHPRTLEAYSILGMKVASSQILSGTTAATIAPLAPGFYLIRLENEVAKAIIP